MKQTFPRMQKLISTRNLIDSLKPGLTAGFSVTIFQLKIRYEKSFIQSVEISGGL